MNWQTLFLIIAMAITVSTCCTQLPHALDHALDIPAEVHHGQ